MSEHERVASLLRELADAIERGQEPDFYVTMESDAPDSPAIVSLDVDVVLDAELGGALREFWKKQGSAL